MRLGSCPRRYAAVSSITWTQKSSCRDEYSTSSGEKIAWRTSSLLMTRPEVLAASPRASVVLPVPGSPAIRTIMSALTASAFVRERRLKELRLKKGMPREEILAEYEECRKPI